MVVPCIFRLWPWKFLYFAPPYAKCDWFYSLIAGKFWFQVTENQNVKRLNSINWWNWTPVVLVKTNNFWRPMQRIETRKLCILYSKDQVQSIQAIRRLNAKIWHCPIFTNLITLNQSCSLSSEFYPFSCCSPFFLPTPSKRKIAPK